MWFLQQKHMSLQAYRSSDKVDNYAQFIPINAALAVTTNAENNSIN